MPHRRIDVLPTRLRLIEPIFIEACLTVGAAWASSKLFMPPSNFKTYAAGFRLVQQIGLTERGAAIMLAASVAVAIVGFILSMHRICSECGLFLRMTSLAVSGFFWVAVGISYYTGNRDSLAAGPMIWIGVAAWWTILRGPDPLGAPPQ